MTHRMWIALTLLSVLSACAAQGEPSDPDGNRATNLARGSLLEGEGGMADLYAYEDPLDDTHYGNVFRFPSGNVVSVLLTAESQQGKYGGDKIGVYDLTDPNHINGWRLDSERMTNGEVVTDRKFVVDLKRDKRDVQITVRDGSTGMIHLSLDTLYRWRVYHARYTAKEWADFFYLYQGGPAAGLAFVPKSASTQVLDPNTPRADLAPRYVVFLPTGKWSGQELPLGDSGYLLKCYDTQHWKIQLADSSRQ